MAKANNLNVTKLTETYTITYPNIDIFHFYTFKSIPSDVYLTLICNGFRATKVQNLTIFN